MTLGQRLGTARFWMALGQAYAESLRSGASASAILASAAKYLGLESGQALGVGIAAFCTWPLLALGFGYAADRWRLIHAEQEKNRDVNPAVMEQLALLRQIDANTRHAPLCTCGRYTEANDLMPGVGLVR